MKHQNKKLKIALNGCDLVLKGKYCDILVKERQTGVLRPNQRYG